MFNKTKAPIWLSICAGIVFPSMSHGAQEKTPYTGLSPDIFMTFGTRTSPYTKVPLQLSLSLTPRVFTASSRTDAFSNQVAISQASMQEMLQKNRGTLFNTINTTSPSQVSSQVWQYTTTAHKLSVVELKTSSNYFTKELYELRNQLNTLLANRQELLREIDLPEGTVLLAFQEGQTVMPSALEYAYVKNEIAILEVQFAITVKEQCLQYNQSLIEPVVAELSAAQANFISQTPNTTPYVLLDKEILKLQYGIDTEKKLLAQTEPTLSQKLIERSAVQEKIEELDHWYKIGYGEELSTAETREKMLTADIHKIETTIISLRKSIRTNQDELARLKPIAAYGKKCVEDYTYLQEKYKTIENKWVVDTVDKERFAAVNEVLASQGLQDKIVIELTREGQELLKFFGLDVEQFKSFTGNAFQRQLSNELCGIINRSGKTLVAFRDATVRAYVEATARTCEIAAEMLRKNTPLQSIAWTNLAHLCEQATDIAKGVVRGTVRGVVESYEGLANMVVHPQQFVAQCKTTLNLLLNINKDGKLLETVREAYKQFSHLPFAVRVEHVTAMLTSFIIPSPKLTMLTKMHRSLENIGRVMKIEAAALRNLYKIEQNTAVLMKGVAVPERWAPTIEKLVAAGKVTTGEDVTRWMKFLDAPLSSSVTDAVHETMNQLRSVLPKEKLAELATVTITKATQIEQRAKAVAATVSEVAPISHAAQATFEAEVKAIAAQQIARTSTTLAQETLTATAQTAAKISKEEAALAKAALQAKPTTHVASTAAEVKITAATQAAQHTGQANATMSKVKEGFKVIADTAGDYVGRIDHLPIKCPTSKELYHHLFRVWESARGKLTGGHMPRKYPELVAEVSKGPNANGIKQIILQKGELRSFPKTVGPDSWNQVDYVRHLEEAYENIVAKEFKREGVSLLTGIDKTGIAWDMLVELKEGVYKLTTGYPKI